MNTTNVAKNKTIMMLFVATFIAPIVAAALLLNTGWYRNMGTANRGALIQPPVAINELVSAQSNDRSPSHTWKILFIQPQQCDIACENSLFVLEQLIPALGPDKKRVEKWVLHPAERQSINERLQHALNTPLPSEAAHLYLVDPDGFIFMHYPAHSTREQAIKEGLDIVKDLKHALKLSRIG